MAKQVDDKERQATARRVGLDRTHTASAEPAVCPTRVVFAILANLESPAKDRTGLTSRT